MKAKLTEVIISASRGETINANDELGMKIANIIVTAAKGSDPAPAGSLSAKVAGLIVEAGSEAARMLR